MLVLKTSVLLAALLALTASTTAATAPTAASSAASEWTYWTSNSAATHSASQLLGCVSEVARIQDHVGGDAEYYLHRAPSNSACVVISEARKMNGLEEVVLFKPAGIVSPEHLTGYEMSWSDRALLYFSSRSMEDLDALAEESAHQVSFHLSDNKKHPHIISATNNMILVTVSAEALATIDQSATFDTRVQRLIFHPTSVYPDHTNKLEPRFKKPKYSSIVAKIASSSALNPARILKDLRILTGEDPQPADVGEWHSRHSSTYGARLAAKWIRQQLEQSLASLNGSSCRFFEYSPYFAPNVVCEIPRSVGLEGEGDDGVVIVSAHYDSRGTFGSTIAPGGDDDASGTSALLAIARTIGSSQLSFNSPIQLIAFSGEEQGLVGSQHYASHLASLSTPVKLAIQMDMLAYRQPGEPLQIAFPDKLATTSATNLVWNIADIYAPELEQGYTPACCSDHQSFWENNFPATWVFERNGPIADPMYHNSGDVTNRTGYDVQQLASIAKVVAATLLDVAGFQT